VEQSAQCLGTVSNREVVTVVAPKKKGKKKR
jgi:hypothetical protein